MLLKDLMADRTTNPAFKGAVVNDDWVLAVGLTESEIDPNNFAVVEVNVAGLDAQMNPITQDKVYMRVGTSTTKTGTQRTFKPTGDRYIGDDFQDMCFSHAIKYGTGSTVIRPYVYFHLLSGLGESGKVSVMVNSDASGNAGESSTFDVDLKVYGSLPEEYSYTNVAPVAETEMGSKIKL